LSSSPATTGSPGSPSASHLPPSVSTRGSPAGALQMGKWHHRPWKSGGMVNGDPHGACHGPGLSWICLTLGHQGFPRDLGSCRCFPSPRLPSHRSTAQDRPWWDHPRHPRLPWTLQPRPTARPPPPQSPGPGHAWPLRQPAPSRHGDPHPEGQGAGLGRRAAGLGFPSSGRGGNNPSDRA